MFNNKSTTLYIKSTLGDGNIRANSKELAYRVIKEIEKLKTQNKRIKISLEGVILTADFLLELVRYAYESKGVKIVFTDVSNYQMILVKEAFRVYFDEIS